jgi:hypothetical protein
MNVLVVDVGATHVKILATGKRDKREFASGPRLTAPQMVSRVRKLAQDWTYQAVSIGYPGPVLHNRPVADPRNLGAGWMGFNFEEAFKRPTKIVNDAAMQALGSYHSGKMLFLGLEERAWGRPLSRTVFSSLWSLVICHTREAHMSAAVWQKAMAATCSRRRCTFDCCAKTDRRCDRRRQRQ